MPRPLKISEKGKPLSCSEHDANIDRLLARENHTGTQPCETISDFDQCVTESPSVIDLLTRINNAELIIQSIQGDIYNPDGTFSSLLNALENRLTNVDNLLDGKILTNSTNITNLQNDVSGINTSILGLDNRLTEAEQDIDDLFTLIGGEFNINNIARLDIDNVFHPNTNHDFSNSNVLLGPTSLTILPNANNENKDVINLGWLVNNLPYLREYINNSNNKWTGNNIYESLPEIIGVIDKEENSEIIPTTTWVRYVLTNTLRGNKPAIYKSLTSADSIEWTNGNVIINQEEYEVNSGSYTYTNSGLFYVVVDISTGNVIVNPINISEAISNTQALIGIVEIILEGLEYKIIKVNNLDISLSEYARLNTTNRFTAENIFKEQISLEKQSKANYEISPDNYENKTIANTEWVTRNNTLSYIKHDGIVIPSHILEDDVIFKYQGRRIEGDHPNSHEYSNQLTTSAWVRRLIGNGSVFPSITVANKEELRLLIGDGIIELPLGFNCDGDYCDNESSICNIEEQEIEIDVNTKYIYVKYIDCSIVVTEEAYDSSFGKLIGLVDVTEVDDEYEIEILIPSSSLYAPIDSPFFIGDARTTHPPNQDCDNSIATTKWVCDRIYQLLHGPCEDYALPIVIDKGGLLVNITSGTIPKGEEDSCLVNPLCSDLALVDNTLEYIWVRYSDCKVVASTEEPSENEGFLIAEVITNNGDILSINNVASEINNICTPITRHYKAAFGGKIVYIPYIDETPTAFG